MTRIDGPFRTLIEEYGSKVSQKQSSEDIEDVPEEKSTTEEVKGKDLHIQEDRETGGISMSTYTTWMNNMGHWSIVLLLAVIFVLAQVLAVANILWLGWWAGNRFNGLSNSMSMGIYAGMKWTFTIADHLSYRCCLCSLFGKLFVPSYQRHS